MARPVPTCMSLVRSSPNHTGWPGTDVALSAGTRWISSHMITEIHFLVAIYISFAPQNSPGKSTRTQHHTAGSAPLGKSGCARAIVPSEQVSKGARRRRMDSGHGRHGQRAADD
jgi:hypothetical protein